MLARSRSFFPFQPFGCEFPVANLNTFCLLPIKFPMAAVNGSIEHSDALVRYEISP